MVMSVLCNFIHCTLCSHTHLRDNGCEQHEAAVVGADLLVEAAAEVRREFLDSCVCA